MDEKYTRVEHERRFRVPANADSHDHLKLYSKSLEDNYHRVEVRALADSDSERQILS